ncbi:MAG: hypothetical protein COB89_02420 [Piscirickettsiaceae bacterium]|nr:MAG: hypothetical protein COB89_02420 [Piscirickettsiaceae bacterium]
MEQCFRLLTLLALIIRICFRCSLKAQKEKAWVQGSPHPACNTSGSTQDGAQAKSPPSLNSTPQSKPLVLWHSIVSYGNEPKPSKQHSALIGVSLQFSASGNIVR